MIAPASGPAIAPALTLTDGAAALPVDEARWLAALRGEATALARANHDRLDRAGVELGDLVGAGALAYLVALERAAAREAAGRAAVVHVHAFAMRAAAGAMRDALDPADVGPLAHATSLDATPASSHWGGGAATRSLAEQLAPEPSWPTRRRWRGRGTGVAALPRRVRRAIARLSPAQQRVLRLTLQGRGPQEIAGVVGLNENTVHTHKHRALAALRRRLSGRPHQSRCGADSSPLARRPDG